ncbi:hypothetical protein HHI36_001768, partial [Cryptolaemus montrouzieri]
MYENQNDRGHVTYLGEDDTGDMKKNFEPRKNVIYGTLDQPDLLEAYIPMSEILIAEEEEVPENEDTKATEYNSKHESKKAKNSNKSNWNLINKYSGKRTTIDHNLFENFKNKEVKFLVNDFNHFFAASVADDTFAEKNDIPAIPARFPASIFMKPTDERE